MSKEPSKQVVGIRIGEAGRTQLFDPGILSLQVGEEVIVETSRGIEMGVIVGGLRDLAEQESGQTIQRVIRKGTPMDHERLLENREEEKRALHLCQERIRKHKLVMNLVSVEFLYDRSKFIFYFTAENRVDFRELVRDLASCLHNRVELWQIGARDETKVYGGLGICGRSLCCATFLKEFSPVTIKMAKEQSLALNPLKISGVCGRLMCCLRYEYETYREARARLPHEGTTVRTPQGIGRVVEVNALKETILVELENQALVEFEAEKVQSGAERKPAQEGKGAQGR
jgi:cell fate regulator YaaT (PSP1 superfamily)